MKRTMLIAALLLASGAPVAAQNPAPGQPADTAEPPMWRGRVRPGADPARAEQLRQMVEERWGRIVQERLQLNDQQMDRVRTATRAHQDRRRDIARRRMDLERAVGQQMQPGVGADQDSLGRMLDRMARLRVEEAQSDEQLNRDLAFLTPVQRAQFFMMSRRFEARLREIRERRADGWPDPTMRRQAGPRGAGSPPPGSPPRD